jgi:hypothetical protein
VEEVSHYASDGKPETTMLMPKSGKRKVKKEKDQYLSTGALNFSLAQF